MQYRHMFWKPLLACNITTKKLISLKGSRSNCFRFFSNFWRFCYQKKAHIFLITLGEFYSWKMYHLEDTNENVTSYGNHNKAYTIRYGNCKTHNLSLYSNGLTDLTEIWNQDFLGDDASWEIRPGTFNNHQLQCMPSGRQHGSLDLPPSLVVFHPRMRMDCKGSKTVCVWQDC